MNKPLCDVCGKPDDSLIRLDIHSELFRCPTCATVKHPPLLILVKFNNNTDKTWWNSTAMKDEKATDFNMFSTCGWHLRAEKYFLDKSPVIKTALYFEYFGRYKCVRIPAAFRHLYSGGDCYMQICSQMQGIPHGAPECTMAWKERPLYFKSRKSVK